MASENQPESGNNTCDLGTPLHFHFSGRSAKNRFMKVSLTERAATWSPVDKTDNGIPGDELFNLYRSWGLGGYGVVLTGNVMIDRDNLESPGNMIIPIDAQLSGQRLEAFKRLAAEAKTDGSLFIAQVSHPGRQVVSTLQPDPVSASDVQLTTQLFGAGFSKPHPASLEEIRAIKAGFVHAAVFLEKAGFDGIQLHGAHGYLLAQFLSETTNLRTDQYGGSIENRARLITEIADEIRKQTRPDFVLGIKINSVEFQAKGFTVEEAAELCELLEKHQFDFVELSGGTYEEMGWVYRKESTRAREAFFLEFAEMITPRLQHTKTYVTGGLRSARAMVDASKTVDGIGLGRPTCNEPSLAKYILNGKTDRAAIPLGIDDVDFGITATLAGLQMQLIGNGYSPLDVSSEKEMAVFQDAMAAMGTLMENKARLIDHIDRDFLKSR